MTYKVNVENGLSLYKPNRILHWKQSKNDILKLFVGENLDKITNDYYLIYASVFQENFYYNIGFHFKNDLLYKLEFFRNKKYFETHNIYDSYSEFQSVLENIFGIPTKVQQTFSCMWKLKMIHISHYIYERFVPEEHVEIEIK